MINSYLKHITYICPLCSEINEADINSFEIDDAEFLCADSLCKEECVNISRLGEKLKFEINCPVCGNIHNYKISYSTFFLKELFTLSCPETGIKIFFSGDTEKVNSAVKENNEKISQIANLINDSSSDLEIFYETIDLLYEYLKENKVLCSCGSTKIVPDVNEQSIILVCETCGKEAKITPTEDTLEFFLSSGFIKL